MSAVRCAFAHVLWRLQRRDGSLLQQSPTGHQLMRAARRPRVLLAAAYEEDLSEMNAHAAQ